MPSATRNIILITLACIVHTRSSLAQLSTPTLAEQRLLEADTRSLLHAGNALGASYSQTSLADMESRDEREAPAHVQIITSRQLKAFGVRNLLEALQLIPGFAAAMDVDDVIGTSIHGNWSMEGKCLFMLDGKQLNENDFGTYALGHRVPLANVERIEVIVGPGSIMHGGYAALGVVNIVTRRAEHGTGSQAQLGTGFARNGHTQSQASISGAHRLSGRQEVSYLVAHARGNRSNAHYLLPDSTPVSLADSTAFNTNAFQFGYQWRDLRASAVFMEEHFRVNGAGYMVQLRDVVLALEQRTELGQRLQLAWRATQTDQTPWYYINTSAPERLASNTSNARTTAQLTLIYKPVSALTLRIGGQGYRQFSAYQWKDEQELVHLNGARSIAFYSGAWYTEASWRTRLGDLMAGYRQEHHGLAGRFAAPRVAYTKVVGRFHGKALWSEAYRIPTIMNLNYGPADEALRGERIRTSELELGMRIGKGLRATVNAYRTEINDPIVYAVDGEFLDNYVNRPFVGTEGLDFRVQFENRRTNLLAGLAAYRSLPGTQLPEAQVNAEGVTAMQGIPGMRALLAISHELSPWLIARVKARWQSTMWSLQDAGADEPALIQWPSQRVVDLGFGLRPGKDRRLSIDLCGSNLLDAPVVLVNPQSNALMPFQRNGRHWNVGITYQFVR